MLEQPDGFLPANATARASRMTVTSRRPSKNGLYRGGVVGNQNTEILPHLGDEVEPLLVPGITHGREHAATHFAFELLAPAIQPE